MAVLTEIDAPTRDRDGDRDLQPPARQLLIGRETACRVLGRDLDRPREFLLLEPYAPIVAIDQLSAARHHGYARGTAASGLSVLFPL